MADVSRSGDVTSDENGTEERFLSVLSAIGSLRPGVRVPTDDQKAVIDEYTYIKEQLAGPQFDAPAPQITRVEASNGDLRIFGKHLRGTRAINVAGDRVTRARFQITEGVEPHIEAQLPKGAVAGTITVLTTGGVATGQLRLEDSGASKRTTPAPTPDDRRSATKKPPSKPRTT
jgi:hypothetical protein